MTSYRQRFYCNRAILCAILPSMEQAGCSVDLQRSTAATMCLGLLACFVEAIHTDTDVSRVN